MGRAATGSPREEGGCGDPRNLSFSSPKPQPPLAAWCQNGGETQQLPASSGTGWGLVNMVLDESEPLSSLLAHGFFPKWAGARGGGCSGECEHQQGGLLLPGLLAVTPLMPQVGIWDLLLNELLGPAPLPKPSGNPALAACGRAALTQAEPHGDRICASAP